MKVNELITRLSEINNKDLDVRFVLNGHCYDFDVRGITVMDTMENTLIGGEYIIGQFEQHIVMLK